MNNDFGVTREAICQWFFTSDELLANRLTRDPKIVIHGNSCIILYSFNNMFWLTTMKATKLCILCILRILLPDTPASVIPHITRGHKYAKRFHVWRYHLCCVAQDFAAAVNMSSDPPEYASSRCLTGLYTYTLFVRAYGFAPDTTHIKFVNKINGESVRKYTVGMRLCNLILLMTSVISMVK